MPCADHPIPCFQRNQLRVLSIYFRLNIGTCKIWCSLHEVLNSFDDCFQHSGKFCRHLEYMNMPTECPLQHNILEVKR